VFQQAVPMTSGRLYGFGGKAAEGKWPQKTQGAQKKEREYIILANAVETTDFTQQVNWLKSPAFPKSQPLRFLCFLWQTDCGFLGHSRRIGSFW